MGFRALGRRGVGGALPRARARTSATALRAPRATCRAIIVDVAAPTPSCARVSDHATHLVFSRDRVCRLETGPRTYATTRLPLLRLRATRRGSRHSRERLRTGHPTRLGAKATECDGDFEARAFVPPCPPSRVGARPRAWVPALRLRRVAMPRKTRSWTCACSGSRRVRSRAWRARLEGTPRNTTQVTRALRARVDTRGRVRLARARAHATKTTSPTPWSRSRKDRTNRRGQRAKNLRLLLSGTTRAARLKRRRTSRTESRPLESPSAPSRARRRSRSSSTRNFRRLFLRLTAKTRRRRRETARETLPSESRRVKLFFNKKARRTRESLSRRTARELFLRLARAAKRG